MTGSRRDCAFFLRAPPLSSACSRAWPGRLPNHFV